jgi:integrase
MTRYPETLPYQRLPRLIARLHQRSDVGAMALEFTILTASRSREALESTWEEIDLIGGIWTIPATRMKSGQAFQKPLGNEVTTLLETLHGGISTDLVFPGRMPGLTLSRFTLLRVLEELGHADLVPHRFRATFKNWALAETDFAPDVIDAALSLGLQKTDICTQERRALMETWASYCTQESGR